MTVTVTADGQAVRSPGTSTAFRALATRLGIDPTARRYVVEAVDGTFTIDLSLPGEPAAKGPRRR